MPNAITGTPFLSATPTNYSGANSQLSPAIQTLFRGPRQATGG